VLGTVLVNRGHIERYALCLVILEAGKLWRFCGDLSFFYNQTRKCYAQDYILFDGIFHVVIVAFSAKKWGVDLAT
jgi:hypothetical protein